VLWKRMVVGTCGVVEEDGCGYLWCCRFVVRLRRVYFMPCATCNTPGASLAHSFSFHMTIKKIVEK
jgi:hypothetical protein